MKAIFEAIHNLDTDLVVRNLVFSVLYVCGILLFFNYLLWPSIIAFKSQYVLERKEKIITQEIKKGYDNSAQRLQSFVESNQSSFAKLNNHNPLDEVKKFVAGYLTVQSVQKVSHDIQENDQTQSDTYIFTTRTNDLNNLWKLMEQLSSLHSSAVISPPVQISKASLQSRFYEVSFSLEIRSNTYQAPAHIQELIKHLLH